jgi:hypothetical protein
MATGFNGDLQRSQVPVAVGGLGIEKPVARPPLTSPNLQINDQPTHRSRPEHDQPLCCVNAVQQDHQERHQQQRWRRQEKYHNEHYFHHRSIVILLQSNHLPFLKNHTHGHQPTHANATDIRGGFNVLRVHGGSASGL